MCLFVCFLDSFGMPGVFLVFAVIDSYLFVSVCVFFCVASFFFQCVLFLFDVYLFLRFSIFHQLF